jgi:hypothetical protein
MPILTDFLSAGRVTSARFVMTYAELPFGDYCCSPPSPATGGLGFGVPLVLIFRRPH